MSFLLPRRHTRSLFSAWDNAEYSIFYITHIQTSVLSLVSQPLNTWFSSLSLSLEDFSFMSHRSEMSWKCFPVWIICDLKLAELGCGGCNSSTTCQFGSFLFHLSSLQSHLEVCHCKVILSSNLFSWTVSFITFSSISGYKTVLFCKGDL